ncbi:MAG: putative negative regulator of RcsB-dependent stress response [Candidatus Azotimanducaceae bacterium]
MVTDKTEEEQLEALKSWWDENGTQLLIGIVVVLAGIFGYRTWDSNAQATAEAASNLYEDLVQVASVGPFDELSAEDRSTAEFIASQLTTEYMGSVYAHFASLHMAKLDVEAGDLESAEAALRWSLDNGVDDSIGIIVNERLARVLFAKEDFDGALSQLDNKKPGAHARSYEELRGDIYFAMDRNEDARGAYERALAETDNPDAFPYLNMKLQDISNPEKAIAADVAEAEGDTSEG